MADFKKKLIESVPHELETEYKVKLSDVITNGIDYFRDNLPSIPESSVFIPPSGLSMSISGATGSIALINEIETMYGSKYQTWTEPLIQEYTQLQNKQDRKKYIHTELTTLDPKIADEFNLSVSATEKFYNDLTNQNDVGINCRNVLEHLKGTLFQKALPYAKLKKSSKQKVSWSEMADELAVGGIGSPEHAQLQTEYGTHSSLHTDFTYVAKNMTPETKPSIQGKFAVYIDHLFNVLTLTDKSKM